MIAAKTKFFAAATLIWTKWNLDDPNVDPYKVGQLFRKRMADAHFSVLAGDTWVIDEIPRTIRTSSTTRTRLLQLIQGLYNGPGGFRKAAGMAFAEVEKHNGTPVDIITYKTEWKGLIGNNGSFWSSLRPYLLFWSQEVYTWCQYVCVGGTSTLGQKSSRTNEYVEHPARLAFAAGAPAGAANARGFFDVGYQPVENVFWATSSNQSVFMTQFLTLDQIERFASLQVFATRAWAQFNAYPDRRFAFAWNEHPFPTGINANGKRMALATRIAKALRGAYSLNGSALFACDPGGISTSRCNPVLSGASFTAIWASFGSWG